MNAGGGWNGVKVELRRADLPPGNIEHAEVGDALRALTSTYALVVAKQ